MDKEQAEKNAATAKRYDEFIALIRRVNSAPIQGAVKDLLRDIVKAIYKK